MHPPQLSSAISNQFLYLLLDCDIASEVIKHENSNIKGDFSLFWKIKTYCDYERNHIQPCKEQEPVFSALKCQKWAGKACLIKHVPYSKVTERGTQWPRL